MIDLRQWFQYSILTTFIVGHRYVTVWHDRKHSNEVISAVMDFIQNLDDEAGFDEPHKKPFVILSQSLCNRRSLEDSGLLEHELLDICME